MSKHYYDVINPANYVAIRVLEKIGVVTPTQQQINIIESLIVMIVKPDLINIEFIEKDFSDDKLLKHIFQRYVSYCAKKKANTVKPKTSVATGQPTSRVSYLRCL
ncbi:MAG: hypothetical protein Tsb005_06260 [Gammaproteobacteria bacterium]